MRRRRAARALLLTLTTLACAAPLAAGSLETGPKLPVSTATPRGADPVVARGADGAFVVLWQKQDGSLVSRRLSPEGVPEGPESPLARSYSDTQGTFSVGFWNLVALPGGGYFAAWLESLYINSPEIAPDGTRFRLLDASGQPLGPAREIPVASIYPLSATLEPSGDILLLWASGTPAVLAQRFAQDGTPRGSFFLVAEDPAGRRPLHAAPLPDGFAVAWLEASAEGNRILARLHGPDGAPRGPEILVSPAGPTLWSEPVIASGPSGHFAVAWTGAGVRARLFASDGAPIGPEIPVASPLPPGVRSTLQDLNVRDNGAFLIQWTEGPQLLARAVDSTGQPLGLALPLDRAVEPIGFRAHSVPTPTGWIATGSAPETGWVGRGPWVRFLTLPCAGLGPSGLCLNGGRFHAAVTWRVPATGAQGAGTPIPKTGDSGAFWFFDPANHELNVKVLDGRGVNGHFWVFYGSMTDVEFDLTVTDSLTGERRTYHNPAGTMASRADTAAF